jgi:heme-degrading monooxygenase HmoA
MYAQITRIRVPAGQIEEFRKLLEKEYLPIISARPGFVAAYVMEQVDDSDSAEMVQLWDSHHSVENFSRTGLLESSVQGLAARMPGLHIQRQGYIVRVAIGQVPQPTGSIR